MENQDNICYIVGAGEIGDERVEPEIGDFVIAADAGYRVLQSWNITPDLVVGDFDSFGSVPNFAHIIRHPVEKDDTDMALAVQEGAARGYRKFLIYGGTGGRMDHTMANWQLLSNMASKGLQGYLIGSGYAAAVLCNERLCLAAMPQGTISVFCMGDSAKGVSIAGLKYCVENVTLTGDVPLGVSNAFVGHEAMIEVKEGRLLVMWENRMLPLKKMIAFRQKM